MGYKSSRESNAGERGDEPRSDASLPATGKDSTAHRVTDADDSSTGYVEYDPGPDRQALADRYGIDVGEGEARKLTRLESKFGRERVSRWAEEGMPVETMGKPRDMQAFRERQDERSGDVPTERHVQPKLEVSSPDDPAEREAEAVAEAVVEMDEAPAGTAETEPDEAGTHRERDVGLVRTVPVSQSPAGGTVSAERESTVRDAVQGGGKPLPAETRSTFEAKMGTDFSDVQVHTGPKADEAATAINAKAYTIGSDIAFADGNYNPESNTGKTLLAHELTHVAQQTTTDQPRGRIQREPSQAEQEGESQEGESQEGESDGALTELREALQEGFLGIGGADSEQVFEIIRNASRSERMAINNAIVLDDSFKDDLGSTLSQAEMLQALRMLDAHALTQLRTATDAWSVDEYQIYWIIEQAPDEEREDIRNDDPMMDELRSSLPPSTMAGVLEMLDEGLHTQLETAMDGWGTPTTQIVYLVNVASPAEHQDLVTNHSDLLERVSSELPVEDNYGVIDTIWDNAVSSLGYDKKELLFELRYRASIGAEGTQDVLDWMAGKAQTASNDYKPSESELEDIYGALRNIPKGTLAGIDLDHVLAYSAPGSSTQGVASGQKGYLRLNAAGGISEGTAIHEVAHILDKNDTYSGDPEFKAISNWKKYSSADGLLADIRANLSTVYPSSLEEEEKQIVDEAVKSAAGSMGSGSDIPSQVSDMEADVIDAYVDMKSAWYRIDDEGQLEQEGEDLFKNKLSGTDPPLLKTIAVGSNDNQPYFNPGNYPSELQNRYFLSAYSTWWRSLDQSAHPDNGGHIPCLPNKCGYGMKAPGEEFADVFAEWNLVADPETQLSEYADWYKKTFIK